MLNNNITLLDGGMGQELIHRSSFKPDSLWSTRVLLDEYDLVVNLHKDFIKAGADAITINSYGITPHRLKRHNLENMFLTLQQKALAAARQAIDEMSSTKKIQIYGCLPPLIGSYYRTVGINRTDAVETYKKMIEIQENEVDVFICETITSIEEAQILFEATSEISKKVILSFTVDEVDGSILRSGESLKSALAEFENSKIDSFLVNCSTPEAILQSTNILKTFSKPFGALPNGFETCLPLTPGEDVSVLNKRDDFNQETFVNFVMEYIENGASIVGGCCEVSPDYILALSKQLSYLEK